jgi:nucleoside phosphorylase
MPEKRPLAVILTALPEEVQAVRVLMEIQDDQEKVVKGTYYDVAEFEAKKGKIWRVAVAEIGKGVETAIVETMNALNEFEPDCLLFVGVAGGIKDTKIGDVVIADTVYGYEGAKAGARQQARPTEEHSEKSMISLARNIASKGKWQERLKQHTSSPKAMVGPIATGGKVISSTKSEIYQIIKESYNDTVAVEMEGLGFLRALREAPGKPAIVIRGISDLIDNKDEADASGSKNLASAHAAAFAFELLNKFWPRNIEQPPVEDTTVLQASAEEKGSIISGTEFDDIIKENIKAIFAEQDYAAVAERVFILAQQNGSKGKTTGSIADLLCNPEIKIESTIGWLTQAAAETVQAMPREMLDRREAFKNNGKKILGWLVLRTVDPKWLEKQGELLRKKEGVALSVSTSKSSCVEIIIARGLERAAYFEGDGSSVWGREAMGVLRTEGGIEPLGNYEALFKLIWKQRKFPSFEGSVTPAHEEELLNRLSARYDSGRREYLTVSCNKLDSPLLYAEIINFHKKIHFIKLILLCVDGAEPALLVNDGALHERIIEFFLRVINEEQA